MRYNRVWTFVCVVCVPGGVPRLARTGVRGRRRRRVGRGLSKSRGSCRRRRGGGVSQLQERGSGGDKRWRHQVVRCNEYPVIICIVCKTLQNCRCFSRGENTESKVQRARIEKKISQDRGGVVTAEEEDNMCAEPRCSAGGHGQQQRGEGGSGPNQNEGKSRITWRSGWLVQCCWIGLDEWWW